MTKSKRLPGEQAIFDSGRGGAREGAGRPPKGKEPRVRKTYMVDASLDREVRALAEGYGVSQSDLVNVLFEHALSTRTSWELRKLVKGDA